MGHCGPRRNSPIRLNLHRDVLHLHIILGLQNLLCLRLHAPRFVRVLRGDFLKFFNLSVFLILLTVTVCVTIVCTYFLLNAEDYRSDLENIWIYLIWWEVFDKCSVFRWQWTSFLAAGSTAGYVYFYSFYYFFFKTEMYGFFQTTFYFGYMGVFSLGLGMLCGTVSEIF